MLAKVSMREITTNIRNLLAEINSYWTQLYRLLCLMNRLTGLSDREWRSKPTWNLVTRRREGIGLGEETRE